jgi:hypothetical protein
MLSDAATRLETSVAKLDDKVELVSKVLGISFRILFARLIASSLCSFAQSLAFLNAVAPCRKVSGSLVIAHLLS